MGGKAKQVTQNIVDFMRAKQRAQCPVCQLPADVQDQLRLAREKKIRQRDQLEYLSNLGSTLTASQMTAHVNGRHDDA